MHARRDKSDQERELSLEELVAQERALRAPNRASADASRAKSGFPKPKKGGIVLPNLFGALLQKSQQLQDDREREEQERTQIERLREEREQEERERELQRERDRPQPQTEAAKNAIDRFEMMVEQSIQDLKAECTLKPAR